jgi:hypothetical protein
MTYLFKDARILRMIERHSKDFKPSAKDKWAIHVSAAITSKATKMYRNEDTT